MLAGEISIVFLGCNFQATHLQLRKNVLIFWKNKIKVDEKIVERN